MKLCHHHFCLPSKLGVVRGRGGGPTLKEKNLLLEEQILSCKSRPLFGRALPYREKGNHTKPSYSPFVIATKYSCSLTTRQILNLLPTTLQVDAVTTVNQLVVAMLGFYSSFDYFYGYSLKILSFFSTF